MSRDFAMVNPEVLHDPRFQSLGPVARHLLLTALVSDLIGLEGFGPVSIAEFSVTTGYPAEQVLASLHELEDARLIGREANPETILLRNFWSHTTLGPKGIAKQTRLLESGRLSRQLGRLEALWLADGCLRCRGARGRRPPGLSLRPSSASRNSISR